jgi:hypothetical protein
MKLPEGARWRSLWRHSAAPCRIGSVVQKIVAVVGHAAAEPTDACAKAIDS